MDVDADRLTRALADRLAAIVPDGFTCGQPAGCCGTRARPGDSPASSRTTKVGASGTYVRVNFEAYDETTKDPAAHVAAQALSELQDYVDEASHEPWPGISTPPRPFAEVGGPALDLWYGWPDITSRAVLACEPVPLAQIRRLP